MFGGPVPILRNFVEIEPTCIRSSPHRDRFSFLNLNEEVSMGADRYHENFRPNFFNNFSQPMHTALRVHNRYLTPISIFRNILPKLENISQSGRF